MRKSEIRFAVGESGGQLSPVFRIWTQKNNVYLAARQASGVLKISLHGPNDLHDSPLWITAMTSESGLEAKPGNRRMKAWKPPPEVEPGWTQGPHISVARLARHDHGKLDEKPTKAETIEWIPKPQDPDWKATVAVFLGSPGKTLDDFVEQIPVPGEAYIHDHLEQEDGQTVFLMVTYAPLTEADMPTVDFLQSKADEWTDINDNLVACLGIFMQAPPVPWVYILKFASPQK